MFPVQLQEITAVLQNVETFVSAVLDPLQISSKKYFGTCIYWQFGDAIHPNLHAFGSGSWRTWRESMKTQWQLHSGNWICYLLLWATSSAVRHSYGVIVMFGVNKVFLLFFLTNPIKQWLENQIEPDVMRNFPSFPCPPYCVLFCDITVEKTQRTWANRGVPGHSDWLFCPASRGVFSGWLLPRAKGDWQQLGHRHTGFLSGLFLFFGGLNLFTPAVVQLLVKHLITPLPEQFPTDFGQTWTCRTPQQSQRSKATDQWQRSLH